ncbi:type IV secretory system conjugative DNA transfer family protein [Puniceicoccaceae bacterium K14]|nr:type IV secretory system conjugative DNA transfer family protein [Puniceicoccaceae bacterium K14]
MIKRLLFLLLALALALVAGPPLTEILSFIPIDWLVGIIKPKNISNTSINEYFEILVWTVIFFLAFRSFGLPLGFLWPNFSNYSQTKAMRKVQGLMAELSLITFFFFIPIFIIHLAILTDSSLIDLAVEQKALEKQKFALNRIDRDIAAQEREIREIDRKRSTQTLAQSVQARARRDFLQNSISNSRSLRSGLRRSWEKGGQNYNDLIRKNEKPKYILFLIALIGVIRRFWFISLLFALIVLFVVHRNFRHEFSIGLGRFLRFVTESRLGQGGSSRFAGLFEEWELLLSHKAPGAIIGVIPGLNLVFGFMIKTIVEKMGIKRFGNFIQKGFKTEPDLSNCTLYAGRSLYNPFLNIALRDDRHMLTIAGSRSGKGVTSIIPNLLLWEGSTIVIDPKGTNAAVTARRRREMGQNVHLIDPFGIVEKDPKKRATFNPLEGLDPNSETIRETISSIVEALVVTDPGQKDKHWDDGAKTILTGLIGHIISDPRYKGHANLGTIRDMLSLSEEEQTELWADMSLNMSAGNTAKEAASRIVRGVGTDEMLSIFSNADKHTEWLSSSAMQATLGKSSFSFSELKEEPTTIYLILPPHFLDTHKRFLRLFVNLTIMHMSMGGRSKVPVLMMLDEFLALGYMSEVEKAFGLMAGYNLVMWPFVQDFGRLKDLYKNSVNSFVTNSRAVQVFGVSDEDSTKFVSNMIGKRTMKDKKSDKKAVALREPSEVAVDVAAESQRQYILRAGKAPLLLEKVRYFDSDLLGGNYPGPFQDKYDPDPDYAG